MRGWDDPRLYTLIGLRRRGIPPGAIRAFVNELGVTKNVTNIEINRFEQSIRSYLEFSVPRLMMVLDPIEVIIDDLPDDYVEMIEQPFAPKDPSFGVCFLFFLLNSYFEDKRLIVSPTNCPSPSGCSSTGVTSVKWTRQTTSVWHLASPLVC